ncbi:MAG TPA: AraC family transcriptional regulator [Planctomycetota bacterium]|nr:AraC family transcriptional regulator [Planctomycetota bacterium]
MSDHPDPRSTQARMAELLGRLAAQEGPQATAIDGVEVARRSQASRRRPLMYDPMILFLAQGAKRAYLGDDVLQYDPDHYLALAVPVPVECEVLASPETPVLALKITVEPAMLAEILVNLDEPVAGRADVPRGIYSSPLPGDVRSSVHRLLECLQSEQDSKILGRQLVREIVYRVLEDEPGAALRALATRNDHFMRISRVIQHIHDRYAHPHTTEELARIAGMSVSSFHHNFKSVTTTSPLQYVKKVRLHQARLMMVHSGYNASTAATAVGYESTSQFGREFKRFFGATPAAEAATLRSRLA